MRDLSKCAKARPVCKKCSPSPTLKHEAPLFCARSQRRALCVARRRCAWPHAADVRAVLKRQRIVAIEIIRKGAARPGRVRSAEITLFSRQLANLLQAGIPLLSALNIMAASDASAALARVVQAIA